MPTRPNIATFTGLAALLVTACPNSPRVSPAYDLSAPGAPAAARTAEPAPSSSDPERVREMHRRFDALGAVVPALVRGDVDHAATIGDDLRRDVAAPELKDELHRLAQAHDLDAAAAATARVAASCGACHKAQGVEPVLPEAPEPQSGKDEAAKMRLHAWGVDRLWEGLAAPSDDRWLRGTATFAALPGCEDSAADKCRRVRVLSQRAHVADATSDRVKLYGQLLATCSDCHREQRGSISATPRR